MLQTGMGAHPQLLSRLYVSSKDWPSLLMSSLMTVPRLGWTRSSFSPAAPRQGGGAWAQRAGGTARPYSYLLTGLMAFTHCVCPYFVERPCFFVCILFIDKQHCWDPSTSFWMKHLHLAQGWEPSFCQGPWGYYNIICGPYKMISLKVSLCIRSNI